MANEFDDLVNDEVSAAEAGGAESIHAGFQSDEQEVEAAPPTPGRTSAPAAPQGWQAPQLTKEQYEALERDAAAGRKYSPYAKHFDTFLERAVAGQAAPAQAPAPKEPDDYERFFKDGAVAPEFWGLQRDIKDAAGNVVRPADNTVLPRALKAFIARELAPHREWQKQHEGYLNKLAGDAFWSEHRFVQKDDWDTVGQPARQAYDAQKFNDPKDAIDHARAAAKLAALEKGATPAQAQAAGQRAAAQVAAGAAPRQAGQRTPPEQPRGPDGQFKTAPKGKAKPEPEDEPSLRAGARRGGSQPSGGGSAAVHRDNDLKRLVGSEFDAALASIGAGGRR